MGSMQIQRKPYLPQIFGPSAGNSSPSHVHTRLYRRLRRNNKTQRTKNAITGSFNNIFLVQEQTENRIEKQISNQR